MGLDFAFRHLITQVGWAAPLAITALVIGGWALLRRDEGMWWKLVVGGVAALLAAQAVSVVGTFMLYQLDGFYRAYWIVSLPTLVLNVVGLALLGAGAVSGRRGTPGTSR